eukprot:1159589-Pelagomonas_calceolata.AAC.16
MHLLACNCVCLETHGGGDSRLFEPEGKEKKRKGNIERKSALVVDRVRYGKEREGNGREIELGQARLSIA